MQKRPFLAIVLSFAVFAVACDDDGGTDAGPADSGPGTEDDAGTDAGPMPDPANFGDACTTPTQCTGHEGGTGICLTPTLFDALPDRGYCSQMCAMDEDCGDGSHCEATPMDGFNVCVLDCNASNECDATDLVCTTRLAGSLVLASPSCLPGDNNSSLGAACETFANCRADDACNQDPYTAPGGLCIQLGCDTSMPTCDGGAGACVEVGGEGICLPLCTMNDQCRMAEGYICIDSMGQRPGDMGFMGGVCATAVNIGGTCDPTDAMTVAATCQGALAALGTDLECAVPTGFLAPVCSPVASTATNCADITCSTGTVCYDADDMDETNTVFCADLCDPTAPAPCNPVTNVMQTCTDISDDMTEFACLPPAAP